MSCLRVARAVRESVLDAYPKAELSLTVVWIDVIASDGVEGAGRSSELFDDHRVKQFHDRRRLAGRDLPDFISMPSLSELTDGSEEKLKALEKSFQKDYVRGAAAVFDTVFFFDAKAEWSEKPPKPVHWVTQLDPGVYLGVDKSRFRFGEALAAELKRLTGLVLKPTRED